MFRRVIGLSLGIRHLQCFLVFIGWASACSIRVNMSLAIVAMTSRKNETVSSEYPVFSWDESMQGTILSSFFFGYLLSQFPAGPLAENLGPKFLLTFNIFCSGLITMLTPFLAIHGGFYWLVLARALVGVLEGCLPPAIAFFLARWVPIPERGRLITFVMIGNHFGSLVTPAAAGMLAASQWGWPSIFYATGGISVLWAILFSFLGSSSPQDHKIISVAERKYILQSLAEHTSDRTGLKTPWKSIATSVPVWAMLISMFGDNWGFFTLLTQIPRYINGVFGSDIKHNGFLSALPFASSFVLSFVYAAINDALVNKNIVSRSTSKKIWNSVASWGPAVSLFLLSFGPQETLAVILFVSSTALNGACYLGVFSNHIDLSPNFAGTIAGITGALSMNASIAAPLFVGQTVTDRTSLAQWRIVFLTASAMCFFGNLIYIIFGTAEVQPWNFPPKKQETTPTASGKKRSGGNAELPLE